MPDANDMQAEQPTVISHALALKLFGDSGAVGRLIFDGRRTYRVMGVTREIVASLPSAASDRYSMIIATRFPDVDIGGMYLVRAEAGQSDRVLESAKKTLRDLNPTHVQPMAKTFAQFKRERVAKTSALAYMLGFLVIGLVGIALFGIASLTSLWVRQRRTSIGIRRALGATSGQILGYFLVENAVLMAVSGLLGVGLAIAINLMAAAYLSLPSISLSMCLMSFAGMVVLGQAAAFGPALRAARTPPASAIRNL